MTQTASPNAAQSTPGVTSNQINSPDAALFLAGSMVKTVAALTQILGLIATTRAAMVQLTATAQQSAAKSKMIGAGVQQGFGIASAAFEGASALHVTVTGASKEKDIRAEHNGGEEGVTSLDEQIKKKDNQLNGTHQADGTLIPAREGEAAPRQLSSVDKARLTRERDALIHKRSEKIKKRDNEVDKQTTSNKQKLQYAQTASGVVRMFGESTAKQEDAISQLASGNADNSKSTEQNLTGVQQDVSKAADALIDVAGRANDATAKSVGG